jgi:hypothetical protein
MEKVIYALWRDPRDTTEQFREKLLRQAAPKLLELGALGLQINVMDEAVAPAIVLRRQQTMPLIEGVVHLWVPAALPQYIGPYNKALEAACWRVAGWTVTEAEPLSNTEHPPVLGERTFGFVQNVFLRRPPRLTQTEWLEVWHKEQTQVAMDCQGNFFYQHNVFVRPVTYDAPDFQAMVEESLPNEAMTDPRVFVNAAGQSDEVFHANAKLLAETSMKMADTDKIDVIATSQYVFKHASAR